MTKKYLNSKEIAQLIGVPLVTVLRWAHQGKIPCKLKDDVYLFLGRMADPPEVDGYEDVPLSVLLPAYLVSELKIAFLIGFQIYLPFLIIDMVIASVMVSMGMLMLPPVLISLPFKLMLFVLLDGWNLVVGMLMDSFAPYL